MKSSSSHLFDLPPSALREPAADNLCSKKWKPLTLLAVGIILLLAGVFVLTAALKVLPQGTNAISKWGLGGTIFGCVLMGLGGGSLLYALIRLRQDKHSPTPPEGEPTVTIPSSAKAGTLGNEEKLVPEVTPPAPPNPQLTPEEVQLILRESMGDRKAIIQGAIDKFVLHADPILKEKYPKWFQDNGAEFRQVIERDLMPGAMDMGNPFILRALLEVLPILQIHNYLKTTVLQWQVLDLYIKSSLLPIINKLSKTTKRPDELMVDINLRQVAEDFCSNIAKKMFENGITCVIYDPTCPVTQETWELYFDNSPEVTYIRDMCCDLLQQEEVHLEGRTVFKYSFKEPELYDFFLAKT